MILIYVATLPVKARNGGFFISRGKGEHPDRVIDSHELIFVTKGVLSIIEGNHRFDIKEGESLILWPHRRHKAARHLKLIYVFTGYILIFRKRECREAERATTY